MHLEIAIKISLSFFFLSFTFHRLGGSLLCMNWGRAIALNGWWPIRGVFRCEMQMSREAKRGTHRSDSLFSESAERPPVREKISHKKSGKNQRDVPFRSFSANQIKMQNAKCIVLEKRMGILWKRSTVVAFYSQFIIWNRISNTEELFRI